MHILVRRFLPRWQIRSAGIEMFRRIAFPIERYRYQGTRIPNPWSDATSAA